MRKFFILLIFSLFFVNMNAQEISSVGRSGGFYNIYESSGKKITSITTSAGVLVGYSSKMMILKNGSWYQIYNSQGKKVKSLSVSYVGEIINVVGNNFISKNGSWIYTWDMNGNKINTDSASKYEY